ncbi:MAG: D-alanyl-D-alanine carboxypeptidase [Oscillospiraceae bacterium]|nr:D-alanyl-D-alanine carboxypeptidase [Oscillospiraceae bacterium]
MKRTICAVLIAAVLFAASPTQALAANVTVSAQAAILIEADTGRILYEKNADAQRSIASTTKLMTALVVAERGLDMQQKVVIKPEWTGAEGTSLYLKANDEITVEALLYGLLLQSGNDAAIALAGYCAGDVDTFVSWMNLKAEDLEMTHSHFENPNGLDDEGHYSTASDMAILAQAVMHNKTLAAIVGTKSITVDGWSFVNHNKLLWRYDGCIGLKTGYTGDAGRTLVSCAERDGLRLIAVTLGAPDDWNDHSKLFDYGFSNYTSFGMALAGRTVRTLPVTGSVNRFVSVITEEDAYYPLTEEEDLTAKIKLPAQVQAPVKKGEIAGSLDFYLDGVLIGSTYLVYAQDVQDDLAGGNGFFKRLEQIFYPKGKETSLSRFLELTLQENGMT